LFSNSHVNGNAAFFIPNRARELTYFPSLFSKKATTSTCNPISASGRNRMECIVSIETDYSLGWCTDISHFDYAYQKVIKYVLFSLLSTYLYCLNWLPIQFSNDATQVLITKAARLVLFLPFSMLRNSGENGETSVWYLQESEATNISTL
jgi:hypothetical protein